VGRGCSTKERGSLRNERAACQTGRHLGSSLLWQSVAVLQLVTVLQLATVTVAFAQDHVDNNRYVPVDQYAPVGRVGRWTGIIGKGLGGTFQSVQVALPTTGKVTVYNGGPQTGVLLPAPAQFTIGVGYAYRLKISDMPEFPGVELYPTIEIFDRLHPPVGREAEFPVPIALSADDIQKALKNIFH